MKFYSFSILFRIYLYVDLFFLVFLLLLHANIYLFFCVYFVFVARLFIYKILYLILISIFNNNIYVINYNNLCTFIRRKKNHIYYLYADVFQNKKTSKINEFVFSLFWRTQNESVCLLVFTLGCTMQKYLNEIYFPQFPF